MVAPSRGKTDLACTAAPEGRRERDRRTTGIGTQLRLSDLQQPDRYELTNRLIETHIGMAKSMAGRYRNRGVDTDDLEQVALLALTKAAQKFDPEAGYDFVCYAVPTIRGEIRRHFRDSGWMVRPPRRVQELQAQLRHAQRELELQLGRSPRPTELAARLGEDLDLVVEALSLDGCFTPTSLDAPVAGGSATLSDLLTSADRDLEAAEARTILAPALQRLADRDRLILKMRYVQQRSQKEIAEAIGSSQAQVSRILNRVIQQLRDELVDQAAATGTPTEAWAATGS